MLRLEQEVIIAKLLLFSGQNKDLLVLEQRKGVLIRVMPLLFGLPSLLSRTWIYLSTRQLRFRPSKSFVFYLNLYSDSPCHDCQTSGTENNECYSWVNR